MVYGRNDNSSNSLNASQALLVSPYTFRKLKPFIRRDFDIEPPKLKILRQIQQLYQLKREKTSGFDPDWAMDPIHPIDFCYFRQEHLPQVNAFLRQHFWPGIDIAESLDYPDFSVVVLYKRIVIGCAFMTPGAYISYIAVHPDWRRRGIGTFMMYHLIQTCQGKDVSLHVSANGEALFLYQKFGFKREQFIVNFYDKYLPDDTTACKNAVLLRLRR